MRKKASLALAAEPCALQRRRPPSSQTPRRDRPRRYLQAPTYCRHCVGEFAHNTGGTRHPVLSKRANIGEEGARFHGTIPPGPALPLDEVLELAVVDALAAYRLDLEHILSQIVTVLLPRRCSGAVSGQRGAHTRRPLARTCACASQKNSLPLSSSSLPSALPSSLFPSMSAGFSVACSGDAIVEKK